MTTKWKLKKKVKLIFLNADKERKRLSIMSWSMKIDELRFKRKMNFRKIIILPNLSIKTIRTLTWCNR